MAITEKYVTTTGAGAHDGSSEANALSWTELTTAMTGGTNPAAAGYRYNVKAGSYSSLSTATWTSDGTTVSPIIIRGYNSTIGDLDSQGRTSGNGALNTTNFPVLAFSNGAQFDASDARYVVFQNLKITGNYAGLFFLIAARSSAYRCYVSNASTDSTAAAIMLYSLYGAALDCDAEMTGASGGLAAIRMNDVGTIAGCRIISPHASGVRVSNGRGVLAFNVIPSPGVDGIEFVGTEVTDFLVCQNNTIYAAGRDGISVGNQAYTSPHIFINNHITDCTGYAFRSNYSGTANIAALFANNRTRDNGGVSLGFTDWLAGTAFSHVTTDTGGAATDYTNAGSNDLTLISAAPGKGVGLLPYTDIGALQRQESAGGGGVIGNNMEGGFA